MTVVRPNSIAGINSITVQTGQALNIHDASGNLIRNITSSTGISTFQSVEVTSGDLKVGVSTFFVDKSTGRVGVGTAVPGVEFSVAGAGTLATFESNTGDAYIGLLDKQGAAGYGYIGSDAGSLMFQTSGSSYSTKLEITQAGLVNIGGAAVSQSRSLNIGSNAEANLAIETHNNATSETANIRFYKSGNTGASPQVVETDDNIAQLIAYGHDGTDYANAAASIKMSVDGAPGSNDMPGKIILSTTADGGTSPTERMRIKNDGRILISSDISTVNVPLVEIYNTGAQAQEGACLKLRSGRGSGVKDTAIFGMHDDNDREFFRIQNDGVVGVNTVTFNTGSKLESSSEGAYNIIARSQNGNGGYHNFTGQSSGGTNTSYITHNGRGYFEDGVQFDSSGETLSSYEEGTWTPECRIETRAASDSPTDAVDGCYTKVGRLVTCHGRFTLNGTPSERSTSRAIEVHGFPFDHNHDYEKISGDIRVTGHDVGSTYGQDIYFVMRMISGQQYCRIEIIEQSYNGTRNASIVMQDNMNVQFTFTFVTV